MKVEEEEEMRRGRVCTADKGADNNESCLDRADKLETVSCRVGIQGRVRLGGGCGWL